MTGRGAQSVAEWQREWRVGRGGGVSRRSALPSRVSVVTGRELLDPSKLDERFWTGAATAAQAANEVKERGDPILKG
jgi:hypothetical protein